LDDAETDAGGTAGYDGGFAVEFVACGMLDGGEGEEWEETRPMSAGVMFRAVISV
jgi:hypothetical protein